MNGLHVLIGRGLRCLYNYRCVVRTQSLFKIIFSGSFMVVTLVGLFFIFYGGFVFLDSIGGVGLLILNRLFALFFFGLGILLVLSSAVTAYASFYKSPEMPFLLLRPFQVRDVLMYTFFKTAAMSSWAFFFIILPFVGAYAYYENISVYFALWTLIYSLPFVLICCFIGTLITMFLVRFLPRGKPLMIGISAVLIVIGVLVLRSVQGALYEAGSDQVILLNKLIPGFRFTSHPIWPSYWVADGMMSMTRDQWGRGLQFMALLLSWVGVLAILFRTAGEWMYFDGWQKEVVSVRGASQKCSMLKPLEHIFTWFSPSDFRALLFKDLRTFLRDPAQWSQGLIFYGILGLYFINLRNLQYHTLSAEWRNTIVFLNVFSVSAVMCSVGARFVYPQLSLEGQGFWIVGMSPVSMGRVLVSKFVASLFVLMMISMGLMYVSVQMLDVDSNVKLCTLVISVAMSFTVAGMSTGFGGLFIDLKQRNPAAIISSFGGTLNLVMNLCFMFAAIIPFASIFHVYVRGQISSNASWMALSLAYLYLTLLTAIAAGVPMALGRRSLLAREF